MSNNIVNIMWDEEAKVWIAVCNNLGLALESESYDKLISRVIEAAPEMALLHNTDCSSFIISTLDRCYSFDSDKSGNRSERKIKYWVYEIEMSEKTKEILDGVCDICGKISYDEFIKATYKYVLALAETDPDGLKKMVKEMEEHSEDNMDIRIVREYPVYGDGTDEHVKEQGLV